MLKYFNVLLRQKQDYKLYIPQFIKQNLKRCSLQFIKLILKWEILKSKFVIRPCGILRKSAEGSWATRMGLIMALCYPSSI